MNPKERVLGANGFEPFAPRINELQIKQGHKERPADAGDPTLSDLPEHGTQGEKELVKNNAQARMDQKIADESPSYKDVQTNELAQSALLDSEPVDPTASDIAPHGVQGKKELAKLAEENAKAQAEFDQKHKARRN